MEEEHRPPPAPAATPQPDTSSQLSLPYEKATKPTPDPAPPHAPPPSAPPPPPAPAPSPAPSATSVPLVTPSLRQEESKLARASEWVSESVPRAAKLANE